MFKRVGICTILSAMSCHKLFTRIGWRILGMRIFLEGKEKVQNFSKGKRGLQNLKIALLDLLFELV